MDIPVGFGINTDRLIRSSLDICAHRDYGTDIWIKNPAISVGWVEER
ncbi:MAG: hypothetical protein F6K34_25830 [Okeania sp. SIO4D6]|nr:hypothetical protein [Okeania sp. SIO4D6]